MSKLGTNASVQPASNCDGTTSPEVDLVQVFNELRDELVSTLWFLLGNPDDAQDAAQEAFLKCWRAKESLKEVRNVRAWIFRIALNVGRDQQRSAWHRRSRQFAADENALPAGADPPPEQKLEEREVQERLRQAIVQLRPEEKEIFLLRQNGELTFEQIAALRHVPLGTVKTQMRSALQKLREILT